MPRWGISAAFGLDKLQYGSILGYYGTECGNILGLAVLLYFAGLLISLDPGLDWLRFITPYYYTDAARIFDGEPLTALMLTGCTLGALGAAAGLWWYRRKDIA